jgi:hypothetical protein
MFAVFRISDVESKGCTRPQKVHDLLAVVTDAQHELPIAAAHEGLREPSKKRPPSDRE